MIEGPIEVGDKVRINANEEQLAEIGIGSSTRHWLKNGCDKEVFDVQVSNNRTMVYLKDRCQSILWVYSEMVQLIRKKVRT